MKIKPGKPNYKNAPGGELPYTGTEKAIGGPVDGKVEQGLQPGRGVKGSKSLPPAGKK